ncbi:unnamed protein product [Linum trigynum]|uniref:Uncharacterized protein n=1 Tax=Linum trigynum TaxID=586398 RepID=A0AAV2GS81_9ROSI
MGKTKASFIAGDEGRGRHRLARVKGRKAESEREVGLWLWEWEGWKEASSEGGRKARRQSADGDGCGSPRISALTAETMDTRREVSIRVFFTLRFVLVDPPLAVWLVRCVFAPLPHGIRLIG